MHVNTPAPSAGQTANGATTVEPAVQSAGGPTGTATAPQAPQETATVDWKAEAEKWKALSRQNEDRAKANADKAKRFDAIEEQSKSEMQKLLEAKEAAEKRAAAAETASLKARIAASKGVDVDLLTGTTQEEITASADRLLAWRGPVTPPASTSSADAGQRGDNVAGPRQLTREDLKAMTPEQINKARRDGQLNQIMGVS